MPSVPAFSNGNTTSNHFENTPDAIIQISNSAPLFAACWGNVLSIAFFNFFGLSVTKYMSATHRMVLDSLRTIIIWVVGIFAFGETFSWLQLGGFVILRWARLFITRSCVLPCLNYDNVEEENKSSKAMPPCLRHLVEMRNMVRPARAIWMQLQALASLKMDDFLSPKLTHYTQGRAM